LIVILGRSKLLARENTALAFIAKQWDQSMRDIPIAPVTRMGDFWTKSS
jgi:hypothetical protein